MVRYAKLPLTYDVKEMQRELSYQGDNWQIHFNSFYFEGSWTVLALRSPEGDSSNIIPELLSNSEYRDTVYMSQFPSVSKLLAMLECPKMAVRFLNLTAGAVIKQHRDNELAFEKGEARLHFPVMTNPEVKFYIENDRIILDEGSCWYINANLPHRVSNGSNTNRIHLVVDCKVNDWLKDRINSSPQISTKDDIENSELIMIIKELRLQNTDAANHTAYQLEKRLK